MVNNKLDTKELENILNETKETIEIMLENLDNFACLKFFAGKLSLLSKAIFTSINSEN